MPFAYWCVTSGVSIGIDKTDTASFTTTFITAPLAFSTPRNLTITPDGKTLYVTEATTTISIVDTGTGNITGTITTALATQDLDISPDGTRVYAIHAGSPSSTIYVISTASNTVTNTITASSNTPQAQNINVSPDGQHLWIVGNTQVAGNFYVSGIETVTFTTVANIALPATTATNLVSNVGISQDSTKGYVGMQNAGNTGQVCAVLDLVGFSVTTSVALTLATTVTTRLYAVCNKLGTLAFVGITNVTAGLGRVSVVDTVGNTELTSLTGGNFRGFNSMRVTSDNVQVWFANIGSVTGSVILAVSPYTTLASPSMAGPGNPNGVAVTKAGGEPIVMLT